MAPLNQSRLSANLCEAGAPPLEKGPKARGAPGVTSKCAEAWVGLKSIFHKVFSK